MCKVLLVIHFRPKYMSVLYRYWHVKCSALNIGVTSKCGFDVVYVDSKWWRSTDCEREFTSLHTHLSSIVTVALSCTVFEIKRNTDQNR